LTDIGAKTEFRVVKFRGFFTKLWLNQSVVPNGPDSADKILWISAMNSVVIPGLLLGTYRIEANSARAAWAWCIARSRRNSIGRRYKVSPTIWRIAMRAAASSAKRKWLRR